MRKDRRYGDTADTINKLPEFVLAVMAMNDHTQREVASMYEINQSTLSAFVNGKHRSVPVILDMLDYCEEYDSTGRAYRIVQLMNQ
jgi:predicted XRE-type DNA-binding protein